MPEQIRVSRGENGDFVFQLPTEVIDWVQKERTAWSWLSDKAHNLKNEYEQAWTQITKAAQAAISDPTDNRHTNLVASSFDSYTSLIHANSVKGKFLQDLRQQKLHEANSAALFFAGQAATSPLTPEAYSGFLEATLFERGNKTSARAARQAFDQSKSRFEQLVSDVEIIKNDLEVFGAETKVKFTEMQSDWESKEEILLTELRSKHSEALDETKEVLESFKKAYNEELALAAPVTFWTTRRTNARLQAILWGICFTLLVVAALLVIYKFVPDFLTAANDDTALLRAIALLFVLSTPIIWTLRIVARILLSALHLKTDAGEREAMIQTYLALIADGKMDVGQRELVLAAIFRPTATGFVKDDATPPGWSSLVTKLVGEKK